MKIIYIDDANNTVNTTTTTTTITNNNNNNNKHLSHLFNFRYIKSRNTAGGE